MRALKAAVVGALIGLMVAPAPASGLPNPFSPSTSILGAPYGLNPNAITTERIVFDLAIDADTSTAYASVMDRILIIDLNSWEVSGELEIPGGLATAVELLDDGAALGVLTQGVSAYLEFDLTVGTLVRNVSLTDEIPSGSEPFDLADAGDGFVLASNRGGLLGSLAKIDRTGALDPEVRLFWMPTGIGEITTYGSGENGVWAFGMGNDRLTSLVPVDASVSPPTIGAPALDLGDLSEIVIDEEHQRIYTLGGQVLDLDSMEVVGTIGPGLPVILDDADEIVSVSEETTIHAADSLEAIRTFRTACLEWPETPSPHAAFRHPDGDHLILLGDRGLCLEALDGSSPAPATLRVDTRVEDFGLTVQGTVYVVDLGGNEVASRTGTIFDTMLYPTDDSIFTVPAGVYEVLVARPVSRSDQWPFVPAWHDSSPVLSRSLREPIVVEGEVTVRVDLEPFFHDLVQTSQTYWGSIQWLQATGVTTGCGPDRYCPEDFVTRGQMAAFLDRALELAAGGPSGFVDDDGTFEQNIWNLKAAGITRGCAPDRFCTGDYVTRGQMAAFLDRALELPAGGPTPFVDDDGTFEQNIANLFAAGITTGCAQNRYCTHEFVTRAQMAAFLERALSEIWFDL